MKDEKIGPIMMEGMHIYWKHGQTIDPHSTSNNGILFWKCDKFLNHIFVAITFYN